MFYLVLMAFVLQEDQSPLFMASFYGHLDIVKSLIEVGANVNHATKVHTLVSL